MNEEIELTPEELQKTLIGFLGHTYKEVSQFDSRLVSPNSTLMPKKQEFQNIANKVFQEVVTPNVGQIPIGNVHHVQHVQPTHQQNIQPNIQGVAPQIQQVDPNQLEFDFNNSVTALSIDKRLSDIENRIKKLDITLSKVLSLLESDDFTNLKQE
jgi:hypothetical protein